MFEAVPGSVWFHFSSGCCSICRFCFFLFQLLFNSFFVTLRFFLFSFFFVKLRFFLFSFFFVQLRFSSYPNIENLVSVVSQIEFVDPVSVLGWTNADVWKVHLVAVSKLELQYDAKTNSNKRKVRCMLCTSKIWKNGIKGRRMYSLIYETTIRRIVA